MIHRTIALLALLAACEPQGKDRVGERDDAAPGATSGTTAPGTTPSVTPAQVATYDRMFIDHMAPHLEYGMRLAEVADNKVTNPELKTWAENLKTGYKARVDELQNWRKTWFDSGDTPDLEDAPALTGVAPYTPGDWWKDNVKQGLGDRVGGGAGDQPGTTGAPAGSDVAKLGWDPDDVVQALRNTDDPFDQEFVTAMIEFEGHIVEAARAAQTQAVHPEMKSFAQQLLDDAQSDVKQLQAWQAEWSGVKTVPAERM